MYYLHPCLNKTHQHCFAWCITCQILKILVYFDWHSLTRNKRINELSSVYHPMLLLDGIKWVPVGWLHCDDNPGYFHRFLSPIAMLICSFCAEFVKQLWNIINIFVVVVPQRQFRWFFFLGQHLHHIKHTSVYLLGNVLLFIIYFLFQRQHQYEVEERRRWRTGNTKHISHTKNSEINVTMLLCRTMYMYILLNVSTTP